MSLKRLSLSDYPPGACYADGTDRKFRWKWKPVDQKYVDKINILIDIINAPKVEEPATPKKRKGKK